MIPSEWPTCFSSEGVERDEYRLSRQGEQRQRCRASPAAGRGRRMRPCWWEILSGR